jgi:hypothetical protein
MAKIAVGTDTGNGVGIFRQKPATNTTRSPTAINQTWQKLPVVDRKGARMNIYSKKPALPRLIILPPGVGFI